MLGKIKKWFKDRKLRKSQEAYLSGYEWAIEEYRNGNHLDSIEAYVYGNKDSFDIGARNALMILRDEEEKICR